MQSHLFTIYDLRAMVTERGQKMPNAGSDKL
jgi:hypothetical protein